MTRQLVDVPVYTAAEYAERLHDFRVRLEAMTAYCERVGALVVLVIPPGNDADFEPNRSFLPAETPMAGREAFAREFEAARRLEGSRPRRCHRGLSVLARSAAGVRRGALPAGPSAARRPAGARRRTATTSRPATATACRCAACRISRTSTATWRPGTRGAILIDGPAVFRGLGSRGVVGDRFFTDGFHPSLIGYTALAEAILRGLHSRRSFGWGEASPAPVPAVSPSDCARHFGMDQDRWRQICDYAAWFYAHTAFVRFDPSERVGKACDTPKRPVGSRPGTAPEDVGMPGVGTGPLDASEPGRGW